MISKCKEEKSSTSEFCFAILEKERTLCEANKICGRQLISLVGNELCAACALDCDMMLFIKIKIEGGS